MIQVFLKEHSYADDKTTKEGREFHRRIALIKRVSKWNCVKARIVQIHIIGMTDGWIKMICEKNQQDLNMIKNFVIKN